MKAILFTKRKRVVLFLLTGKNESCKNGRWVVGERCLLWDWFCAVCLEDKYPTLFARFQPRNYSNIVFNQIKEWFVRAAAIRRVGNVLCVTYFIRHTTEKNKQQQQHTKTRPDLFQNTFHLPLCSCWIFHRPLQSSHAELTWNFHNRSGYISTRLRFQRLSVRFTRTVVKTACWCGSCKTARKKRLVTVVFSQPVTLSLAGAVTSIIFIATNTCLCVSRQTRVLSRQTLVLVYRVIW